MCNWLVCLAIWMAPASRNIIGKIFAIFFPIMAFVAMGYENSVANMFLIPKAMLMASNPSVVELDEKYYHLNPHELEHLNIAGLFNNLIPVSIRNLVGAVVFIAFFYWVVYIKLAPSNTSDIIKSKRLE